MKNKIEKNKKSIKDEILKEEKSLLMNLKKWKKKDFLLFQFQDLLKNKKRKNTLKLFTKWNGMVCKRF
jgi:hypothetical protein